jgi:hypothetical protein
MTTKEIMINCYFDKLTIKEAVEFAERCYSAKVTDRQIENVKKAIKSFEKIDWE